MNVSMRYGGGSRARSAQMGTGLKNLLSGVSWEDGTININGIVQESTATDGRADRVSSEIPATASQSFLVAVRHSANSAPWIAIGQYMADGSVAAARTTFATKYTKADIVYTWGIIDIASTDTAYIRFSCRTWESEDAGALLLDITGSRNYVKP